MKIKSLYAVLLTEKIAESKTFYTTHFPFDVTFDSDWYVSLRTQTEPAFELALLNPTHETIPAGFRQPFHNGLILNFEMEEVDSVYKQFQAASAPIHQALRSEEFGQRHFIASDPNGVLIDVIQTIPPSEAFLEGFSEEERARMESHSATAETSSTTNTPQRAN